MSVLTLCPSLSRVFSLLAVRDEPLTYPHPLPSNPHVNPRSLASSTTVPETTPQGPPSTRYAAKFSGRFSGCFILGAPMPWTRRPLRGLCPWGVPSLPPSRTRPPLLALTATRCSLGFRPDRLLFLCLASFPLIVSDTTL